MTPVGDTFAARTVSRAAVGSVGQGADRRRGAARDAAAPYRVRSVKNTDARIPGDQFFTDERKATLIVDRRHQRRVDGADAGAGRAAIVPLSPTGRHAALRRAGARRRSASSARSRTTRSCCRSTCGRRGAGRRASWPSAAASRGRPTARSCCSSKNGRLMALPADGRGEARPWRESLHARRRRAGVVARPHALCRARRRSVGHRPRARAGRSPACTRRRSRSWTCTSSAADGTSKNVTGAIRRSGQRARVEPGRRARCTSARSTT